jgi:hypothetical protein
LGAIAYQEKTDFPMTVARVSIRESPVPGFFRAFRAGDRPRFSPVNAIDRFYKLPPPEKGKSPSFPLLQRGMTGGFRMFFIVSAVCCGFFLSDPES